MSYSIAKRVRVRVTLYSPTGGITAGGAQIHTYGVCLLCTTTSHLADSYVEKKGGAEYESTLACRA